MSGSTAIWMHQKDNSYCLLPIYVTMTVLDWLNETLKCLELSNLAGWLHLLVRKLKLGENLSGLVFPGKMYL